MGRSIRGGLVLLAGAGLIVASGCAPAGDQSAREGDQSAPISSPTPEGVATNPIEGASGVGDPLFPSAGNGGIDVEHYDLDLRYEPRQAAEEPMGRLDGAADIRLRATEDLSRFNMDLRGLDATNVTIGGEPARYIQDGDELVITPSTPLAADTTIDLHIEYGGDRTAPDERNGGLYATSDGAIAINQPHGAPDWFPSNDHPTDKATYRFTITVPNGKTALSNGTLVESTSRAGWTTWEWDAPDPMASYLALLAIGDFEIEHSAAPDGTPILDAIGTGVDPATIRPLERTGEMMAFFEELYGDYPFVAYGQVVENDYGTALETQTRSIFGNETTTETTVAHELAHQWFGDWVSPARWSDLWLSEGWAMYSEWLWNEHRNGVPLEQPIRQILSTGADAVEWETPPAAPDVDDLFSWAVYQRGALTLHFLREEVGDDVFFELAREWLERYGGGSATTSDFIALAEEVSGQDLTGYFDAWLYQSGRPAGW